MCLCVSVCVSVCPANILIFYFSATRKDIDLKLIQDTYVVVLGSLRSKVKITGMVYCFFEGTVISQTLSHIIIFS